MESTGEFATAGKFYADVEVTGATADAAGQVTVDFTVADGEGNPVTGLTTGGFNIAKLVPAGGGVASNNWVPYIYHTETVSGSATHDWPNPDGTTAEQGYRENDGTFTDNGDGSYHYVFSTDVSSVTVGGTAITYDRSATHRVSVMLGGHAGATGTATYDFTPDGSAVTETRNILSTASCISCHGPSFHGHGGDRMTLENCVSCHNPSTTDAQSGETLDMKVMIHRIHAGAELATIPGPDGIVFDNPATPIDESADNGDYSIWGYRNTRHEWSDVGFPAVIDNCTKCHQGTGEDVDNWKNVPSRAACGSCHNDVDWVVGTNHGGGAQTTDGSCATCHAATGTGGVAPSVTEAHNWTQHDPRNIPEFDVDLQVSTPANGTDFRAGEQPVITIALSEGGTLLDHTTIVQDTDGKEGCPAGSVTCPPRDGAFDHLYLFVAGPRNHRMPVLTTGAHVGVDGGAGPFDLSAGGTLTFVVDGGEDLRTRLYTKPGHVTVDVADGTFAAIAAATPAEIVAWMNADADFAQRCIAYIEGGHLMVRSRNLGSFFSLQLEASPLNTVLFGGDTSVHIVNGYYPSNNLIQMTATANNDPKAVWNTGNITYTLDAVDDLEPGTYVASVEITDAGRISSTNYRTPSVAIVSFEVGQPMEELPVARNCNSCHWGPNDTGFVLDYGRHNKHFVDLAVDQCGGCHDYENGQATGAWYGANPISRRVHAVHNGAALNFPSSTVGHADGIPGRNWDIQLPQDIRYCESCHTDGTTSGTWATSPNRLACSGCHDSDAAMAHMRLQTWDPTPDAQFNGDEQESCATCH